MAVINTMSATAIASYSATTITAIASAPITPTTMTIYDFITPALATTGIAAIIAIIYMILIIAIMVMIRYDDTLHLLGKFLGIPLHLCDIGSDLYAAWGHYQNGDYAWAAMTLVFTLLPMIITSIWAITEFRIWSKGNKGAPLWVQYLHSLPSWVPVQVLLVLCAPVLALYILVCDFIQTRRGHDTNNLNARVAHARGTANTCLIKLCEGLSESHPQGCLQAYIVAQVLAGGLPVQVWQWVTIVISLITLTYAVTTAVTTLNPAPTLYIIAAPQTSSRVVWLLFGLVTASSRIVTACSYSMVPGYQALWFLPFITGMVATIVVWYILRRRRGSYSRSTVQLANIPHHSSITESRVYVVLSWLLCATFNGFTGAGLVVSTINVGFAVTALFLSPVAQTTAIVATAMTLVVWFGNCLLVYVEACAAVRTDWTRAYIGFTDYVNDNVTEEQKDLARADIGRSILY